MFLFDARFSVLSAKVGSSSKSGPVATGNRISGFPPYSREIFAPVPELSKVD